MHYLISCFIIPFEMGILDELKTLMKDSLLLDEIDKLPYSRDASYFEGAIPRAVVIPSNTTEVSKIMKLCNKYSQPVVTRGGGTSLTGSSTPDNESIVISLMKMNRILEINISDNYVLVEPGVRIDDLNRELSKLGFIYPPDPGSSVAASIGGSISTNAGGLRGATYGSTKNWVLGLEIVMADGTILKTGGRTLKRSAGYDLTSLMIGSEGTLGIITKAFLRITPKPEKIVRLLIYYDDVRKASMAIGELKGKGVVPLIAEFMDKIAINSIAGSSKIHLNSEANFLLIIDIASTTESIERKLKEAVSILNTTSPLQVYITQDEAEMAEIYKLRKGLYAAELGQRSSGHEYILIGDIIVPPSKLPDAMEEITNLISDSKLKVSLFGHIGDGNIHTNIFYNRQDNENKNLVTKFMMELGKIALKFGGSVSSEHGIGLEKKELLIEEMKFNNSEKSIDIMKNIKMAMDPKNILNRGKIF